MNFKLWLFSPYLNLNKPPVTAPFHVFGPDFTADELLLNKRLPRIQAVIMPSFRKELARDVGNLNYDIHFANDLPSQLRSERWNELCNLIQHYKTLSDWQRATLLRILCKLCFYREVQMLESGYSSPKSEDQAEINYQLILSKYAQSVDHENSEYSLSLFENLIELSPKGSLPRVNATYQMVVQNVKHHYDMVAVEFWQGKHAEELEYIKDNVHPFVFTQLVTRFHRVGGFVPQMKKDKQGVQAEMQKSEASARSLFLFKGQDDTESFVFNIVAKEMLYPVLESRTKEALWLEDFDLAYERVSELAMLCPSDARANLQLGEVLMDLGKTEEALAAYERAAFLSPPGAEVAHFMLGQCYESTGQKQKALIAYMQAIEKDPDGISSYESLQALVDVADRSKQDLPLLVSAWLDQVAQENAARKVQNTVQAYQGRQLNEKVKR